MPDTHKQDSPFVIEAYGTSIDVIESLGKIRPDSWVFFSSAGDAARYDEYQISATVFGALGHQIEFEVKVDRLTAKRFGPVTCNVTLDQTGDLLKKFSGAEAETLFKVMQGEPTCATEANLSAASVPTRKAGGWVPAAS